MLVRTVVARWRTPRRDDSMRALVERVSAPLGNEDEGSGPDPSPPQDGGYTVVLAPILPPRDERLFELRIDIPRGDGEFEWSLRSYPRPEGEPPPEVAAVIERFGGAAGIEHIIRDAWPTDVPPIATFEVTGDLPEADHICRVLKHDALPAGSVAPELEGFADAVRTERVGYRFESALHTIQEVEITYLHEARIYRLTLRARAELRVSPDEPWLPFADEVFASVVSRFFSDRRGGQR